MIKIRLLLVDKDAEFNKKFSGYVVERCKDVIVTTSEYKEQPEELGTLIEENNLVIVDESVADFINPPLCDQKKNMVVLHCVDECNESDEKNRYSNLISKGYGVSPVFKFQNAADIMSCIPELARQMIYIPQSEHCERRLNIISLFSFTGGAGNTTLAMSIARLNQQMYGKRTLVVGTGQFSDIGKYFPYISRNETRNVNMLLLEFKRKRIDNPAQYITRDRFGVSGFMQSSNCRSDIAYLEYDDFMMFADAIEKWNAFDTVILDLDHSFSERNRAALKLSDKIIAVSDSRRKHICNISMDYSLNELNEGNKRINVINYHGSVDVRNDIFLNGIDGDSYEDSFVIPFDPDSFFIRDGLADISMTGPYMKSVNRLLGEVYR